MKGSLKAGPTMLPLFKRYMTMRGKPCQNSTIMFPEHDRHTLVIGDEDRQDGEGDGPQTRIPDGVDDKLDLGRNQQVAIPDAGERRGEAGGVGLHGMRAAVGKGRVATQDRLRLSLRRAPSQSCQTQTFRNCGDEASCLFTPAVGEPGERKAGERASEQDSMPC